MILSFSDPTFIGKIQRGEKIHTIRRDKNKRWKPGMKIHPWKGSPRNKGSYPFKAMMLYPDGAFCTAVQDVLIHHVEFLDHSISYQTTDLLEIQIDGAMILKDDDYHTFCRNDGLSMAGLLKWFVPNPGDTFHGRIIHWTGLEYPGIFSHSQQPHTT